jgi:hypothetical protein
VLYRLLAASGCFNVVTAFHVLNRRRLLDLHAAGGLLDAHCELQHRLQADGITDEYGVPITADHPEEYAYALAHQGRRPALSPANLESFDAFCHAVQKVQDSARPLLLKNPFDTANFLFIRDALAQVRFILLHRNPAEVIDSQLRLVRWMLYRRSVYDALIVERYRRMYDNPVRRAAAAAVCSVRLPILFELVFRNIAAGCDYAVNHVDELEGTAISVTYPDVCRDPAGTVARVLAFLGLRGREGAPYAEMIAAREPRLTAEVERRRTRIDHRTKDYRLRFGV